MKNRAKFYEHLEQALVPVVNKVDEHHWEKSRAITIGGAGLSTAILFLLTQININSITLSISFFCSAVAIPVWLALWQVGEAYSFHGKSAHGHFGKIQGFGIGVVLFCLGSVLLLLSFLTLILHFSIFTAFVFLISSVAMVVFVFKHQNSVRQWAEENEKSDS